MGIAGSFRKSTGLKRERGGIWFGRDGEPQVEAPARNTVSLRVWARGIEFFMAQTFLLFGRTGRGTSCGARRPHRHPRRVPYPWSGFG